VETGPGGKDAVAGRLRASDAEREQVVVLLQVAFAERLLTREEFGERIAGALTARTHADLTALTAGIPAKPVAAPRPSAAPARARRPLSRRTVTGGWTLVTGAAMVTDAALAGNGDPTAGLSLLFIVAFVVAFVSWLYAVSAHRGTAAAAQPPAGPAPGGRARAAAPACQPPQDGQADHGPAEATRGRRTDRRPLRPQPVWRAGLASH
jgi:uncharacterized protein DUF1707